MSTKYLFPALAIEEGITAHEKLVLIALADMADDDGVCWPAMKKVAKKSLCSKRTAQRAIGRFEDMQILSKTERPKEQKRNDSNLYQLDFMTLIHMTNSVLRGDTVSPSGRQGDTHRGDTVSPSGRQGDAQVGDTVTPETINKEPTNRTYQEPITGTGAASAAASETAGELFEQFRAAYPASRRKTEVKQARSQFTAALKKVDSPQVLIDAAAAYANYCQVQGTEPRYIKGMWRWLRDERWMDEYEANQQFMSKASRMRARMGVHSPWFPEATAPTTNPFQHQTAPVALEVPRYDNQNILEVKAS